MTRQMAFQFRICIDLESILKLGTFGIAETVLPPTTSSPNRGCTQLTKAILLGRQIALSKVPTPVLRTCLVNRSGCTAIRLSRVVGTLLDKNQCVGMMAEHGMSHRKTLEAEAVFDADGKPLL